MQPNLVGKTIAELREKNGMTQAKLAQALKVSSKTVSRWECGVGFPEITQLPILASIFNVSVDYLLCVNNGSTSNNTD